MQYNFTGVSVRMNRVTIKGGPFSECVFAPLGAGHDTCHGVIPIAVQLHRCLPFGLFVVVFYHESMMLSVSESRLPPFMICVCPALQSEAHVTCTIGA